MWYSIGIKAGMFLVTLGVFVWLGWSVPVVLQTDLSPDTHSNSVTPRLLNDQQGDALLKVNLNQATFEDLRLLPGIGPVLAQRILIQRKEAGPYRTPEDLLAVKGVGAKRLDRLRPFLGFGDEKQKPLRMSRFQESKQWGTIIS